METYDREVNIRPNLEDPEYSRYQKKSQGSVNSRTLPQAIVFSTLVICGVAVFAVVIFSGLNWFLPALAYGFVVYIGYIKFLAD
ncbi:hypothetical protein Lepto7375DRAFT_0928 [Leptolyngbya sp. PCC 7375]|nr:hypothetical protein Lepto7375DRAFT_0928 [Leptolyngbya sp. PCC 7375]